MRLFVALDLDAAIRASVADLLRELRPAAPDIKWVAPEAMHLTLKFIGEQPEAKLEAITESLATVAKPGPLNLRFHGLGCFPNERRPRVFWIGIETPPELARLAGAVEQALAPLGIEREKRPFSPHLTLGRAREGRRVELPGRQWDAQANDDFGAMTATEFFLFQSRLSPAGAQYAKLKAFAL
jgi:2'-5' RNA ligase